jgi:hypothetical protein
LFSESLLVLCLLYVKVTDHLHAAAIRSNLEAPEAVYPHERLEEWQSLSTGYPSIVLRYARFLILTHCAGLAPGRANDVYNFSRKERHFHSKDEGVTLISVSAVFLYLAVDGPETAAWDMIKSNHRT